MRFIPSLNHGCLLVHPEVTYDMVFRALVRLDHTKFDWGAALFILGMLELEFWLDEVVWDTTDLLVTAAVSPPLTDTTRCPIPIYNAAHNRPE